MDRARALAELYPTKPLRDAILVDSSPLKLLEFFATDEGRKAFESLKRETHPLMADPRPSPRG